MVAHGNQCHIVQLTQTPMGLKRKALFVQEQDLVLLITGGHITLKCLWPVDCLINNICSHNNCIFGERDGLHGMTETKVVHRQSCTKGASSHHKKPHLGPDSNATGANRKESSRSQGVLGSEAWTPLSLLM